MWKDDFDHLGYGFSCVAEGWEDELLARASCNYLKKAVKELNSIETRDLHVSLLKANEAFADDSIWDSPIFQRLFQIQQAAKEVGLRHAASSNSADSECSCRLIPTTAIA